jgi:hypothetical protein
MPGELKEIAKEVKIGFTINFDICHLRRATAR